MPYRLRNGLSFCQPEGGHVIFLDVPNDRYFRLPQPAEHAFVSYMMGGGSEADARALVEWNILLPSQTDADGLSNAAMERPTRSAVELQSPSNAVPLTTLLSVFVTTLWMQWLLKKHTMGDAIDAVVACRVARAPHHPSTGPIDLSLLEAARVFRRARLYVPIETCCLLDSMAMARFLAKRGFHANLVFGVTSNPFSAHCWVQVGNVVLNDSVGNANAYTPIRVV